MKNLFAIIGLVLVSNTASSFIDVFETTNGHEPQVAINCGHIPFYIDLQTGSWVADADAEKKCDDKKNKALRYCKKRYPSLNITNIVEANKPVKFNNWCKPNSKQCDESATVTPYRCLVREYEADALMVPQGCKFDHIHNEDLCMSPQMWKKQAQHVCKKKHGMKLKDHGILLPCDTDMFTGVEYVCCPKEVKKTEVEKKVDEEQPKQAGKTILNTGSVDEFAAAIRKFQTYLPMETKGCDRNSYLTKQTAMEVHHRNQIAAVVDEWDEAEKRYNKLKVKSPADAEEKMKRTLEVFRQTLAALEQESKDEKNRLRAEHADCLNTQINKNKRDAMVSYLAAIEEQPANAEKILKAVRKFIQVCEHDRVHSLRHFEHVRNQDAAKAESLRGELLQHLQDLNKVVNESMALLNYLPEIAQEFGLKGPVGGAILKPRADLPQDDHSVDDHGRIKEILESANKKYGYEKVEAEEVPVSVTVPIVIDLSKGDKLSRVWSDIDDDKDDKDDEFPDDDDKDDEFKQYRKVPVEKEAPVDTEALPVKNEPNYKASRSPFAFNAVMGLSCGVLVILLFLVIAMVVRRRRFTRTRVVLAESNDDREHLVEMQKNGFENPTYKFFYY